jgi:glycosyltransferase involved in cell wall biosynthesis
MLVSISVIIPACDASAHLPRCLEALRKSDRTPLEVIVIDDGSKDDTRQIASSFGAKVMVNERRCGPALARNLGTQQAIGNILFFLDSDVCVKPDTLSKVARSFDLDPQLDALIGSYDTAPASPDFISQYRNLMHSYVHQTGAERACTFWSGCGAIRRDVFLEHSGFSEDYGRPAIEDIELGYRLIRAGRKIVLDRSILVTHLKHWSFWGLVKTDILDRGIPWTELILRDRFMPNDLNLQLSQRVSVALVFILFGLTTTLAVLSGIHKILPLFAVVFLMLARWWGEIGSYKRPAVALATLSVTIFAIALVVYYRGMYGLLPPLLLTPVLLLMRHRYNQSGRLTKLHRWYGIVFISCSVIVAGYYLPKHHLIFACFAVLTLLAILNSQFYIFLAGKRGIAFMLCAIPFHLLYHFYNGISFIAGVVRHYWASTFTRQTAPVKLTNAETSSLINLSSEIQPAKQVH